jgi:hypothetical protein
VRVGNLGFSSMEADVRVRGVGSRWPRRFRGRADGGGGPTEVEARARWGGKASLAAHGGRWRLGRQRASRQGGGETFHRAFGGRTHREKRGPVKKATATMALGHKCLLQAVWELPHR